MSRSFPSRIAKLRIFGRSPVGAYLRLNEWIWNHLPLFLTTFGPVASYRKFLDGLDLLRSSPRSASYILNIPSLPSFTGKGLTGYTFEGLGNRQLEFYLADVKKGHDTFIISKRITRIYYVIEGKGYFTIENQRLNVESGMLIEIPPKVEYSYSGLMKLIIISIPRWFEGNDRITRQNPDVLVEEA